MTSKLLINEPPLQVSPTLAAIIGLNEAIFIQQLNYWLMNTKIQGAIIDGEKWIFNSVREWRENNFSFWSEKTISRMIQRLEESGIIISRQIEHSMDRRKLYRINYDVLNELTEAGISEMHEDSETEYTGSGCPFGHWQDDRVLNKELTETTTETTAETICVSANKVRAMHTAKNPKLDETGKETKEKRFKPPTVEEVRAYCEERQNSVDAEKFVDFYASKGWMVGSNRMKDWQASVRTWERKDSDFRNSANRGPSGKGTAAGSGKSINSSNERRKTLVELYDEREAAKCAEAEANAKIIDGSFTDVRSEPIYGGLQTAAGGGR